MRNITLFLLLLCTSISIAQTDTLKLKKTHKGNFYGSWGYTRAWYSKSTIHFVDRSGKYHETSHTYNNYDFTIYNATAHDRPDFDKIKDVINITIPQFVFRIGYYFNNKQDFGIELNYDHAKYVVDDYQRVHIKGDINGKYVDQDTILDPQHLVHFEHTDGANFWMFNFVKRWKFIQPSKNFNVGWVVKAGPGFVYPRTDVTMFGERLNNNWHISGWIVGAETGLRTEFLKHGVFEFTAKGSYADYMKCLVLGKGNGKANHTFWVAQATATIGFMF
ncbi:MAG: hypothetical protein JST26_01310 [Bacteroidetes bacterium]|nr:hypothetical protein [Bacteroidota bacterium]